MKNISYWAAGHIRAARSLIICIKLALFALAYYTGIMLYKSQLFLPANAIYGGVLTVLLIVVIVYPSVKKERFSKKLNYTRQKICDFILPLCAFSIVATLINNADKPLGYTQALGSHIIKRPTAQDILASGKTKGSFSRKEKRILKKEFFKQLKIYATAKMTGDKAASGEAWKTILVIIGALGLTYLLAALVCNLSCSGSDAAAIIVGVLGLVGIVWGTVALIKRINRGPKNKTD